MLGFTFIMCVLMFSLTSCEGLSSKYGVHRLVVFEDQQVYFKREVRGLNYDSLTLSANKDHCVKPNPHHDYIYDELGPITLFYKTEGNTLEIFSTTLAKQPQSFPVSIKIVQHKLSPLEFAKLKQNYKERGLEILEVNINETLSCNR